MTDAKFKRGHPKKGGKKKGTPNKFTNLKQAYLDVFEKIEKEHKKDESIDSFYKWAIKNQRNQGMFYQMISKMLPSNVSMELGGKLEHAVFMMPRPGKKEKREEKEKA